MCLGSLFTNDGKSESERRSSGRKLHVGVSANANMQGLKERMKNEIIKKFYFSPYFYNVMCKVKTLRFRSVSECCVKC